MHVRVGLLVKVITPRLCLVAGVVHFGFKQLLDEAWMPVGTSTGGLFTPDDVDFSEVSILEDAILIQGKRMGEAGL
jgi:hypothetical protein